MSKTFDILFQKHLIFYSEKEVIPENDCSVPEFSFLFFANLFIAYHISKFYLQLERKASLYLAQNFRFLFSEKRIVTCKKLFVNLQNIKRNNFQF